MANTRQQDWWVGRPWRMIQTNLREIDMLDIRADQVVRDLQSFHANVVMINAAGIIASYPTELPFHFQSQFLEGDSLAQIIDACHAADIRVIARTDFSKVRRPLHDANPHWAYRTPDGDIVDYNGDVHVCPTGEYQQELALRIIEECLTALPFDGIFFNMGGFVSRDYSGNHYGPCHCASCQRQYGDHSGLDLPATRDVEAYQQFCRECMEQLSRKYVDRITALRPDVCIANHTHTERGFTRPEANTGIGRPLPRWMYQGGDNVRRSACNHPNMVCSNTTVDFIDYPYRHVTVSPHLQSLRLVQALACGGALDWYLIGRIDNHRDRTGFEPVRRIFGYHVSNEAEYADLQSAASVVLMTRHRTESHAGWYRALTELHHPFDVYQMRPAANLIADRHQLIVVPDLGDMAEDTARRIEAFVRDGGCVIITGRTSLHDLAGITGEQTEVPYTDSTYFTVDDKQAWPGFENCDLIFQHGPRWITTYADDCQRHLKTVPPHHFGPPERCYFTRVVDEPALVSRAVGRGRVIYLPWLPGQMYWQHGWPNTTAFVRDVLAFHAGLRPVGGNLSPMVEVTCQQRHDALSLLVHLVNHSGHFGISWHEPITMADLRFELPGIGSANRVRSLVHRCDYASKSTGSGLAVDVPRLGEFDAIRIDLPD